MESNGEKCAYPFPQMITEVSDGPKILCLEARPGVLYAGKMIQRLECHVSQGQRLGQLYCLLPPRHLEQYLAYGRHSIDIS